MTTVAYKDGRMVSDRRLGYHNASVQKIFQLAGGSVIGFSGSDLGKVLEVLDAVVDGRDLPDLKGALVTYLQVNPDRSLHLSINGTKVFPLHEAFFAIGSGSDYAMGAMAAGASAEEAVAIASRFDDGTGPERVYLNV